MERECKKHGMTNHTKRSDRRNGYTCVKCSTQRLNAYRNKNMNKAYAHKGNKCSRCGYDKCKAALEFHHRNPSDKLFEINRSNTISWKRIEKEIEKCDLICANCHREIHDEMRKKLT